MNEIFIRITQLSFKKWLVIGLIFLCGIFAAFLLRFWLVGPAEPTHYHANFALYVNGERDTFKDFTFYEEVQACSANGSSNPRTRVHMHNQKNSEVHVHDAGATWGHFFANLGYGLTNNVLQTEAGLFVDDTNGAQLTFILNGEPVSDIYNRTIGDEDTLLVNYGVDSQETITSRYEQIQKTAEELDASTDPAGCAGSQNESLSERFKRTLGVSDSHSH